MGRYKYYPLILLLLRYQLNIRQKLYRFIPLQVGGVALPKAMTGWLKHSFVRYLIGGAILLSLFACKAKPSIPIYGNIPIGTTISSLEDLQVLAEKYSITRMLVVSSDEVSVELAVTSLPVISLVNDDNVWHLISTSLPIPANIKNIAYIAVYSDYIKYPLAVLRGTDREQIMTAYDGVKRLFSDIGTAHRNDQMIRQYMKRNFVTFIPARADSLLAVFTNGKEQVYNRNELNNLIDFKLTHWQVEDDTLAIVWENYPKKSIYGVYPPEKKLLILIDGLGYNMLQNAKAHNKAGYFANLDFEPMRTTYPSSTKYAYYAAGNGHHLNQHTATQYEIFSEINASKGYIIEEDKIPFGSKFTIVLNTDQNRNGTIDDEIFASAMKHLDEPFDFMLIHFHSIDNTAHQYGPFAPETMNQIETVGDYVRSIIEKYDDDAIIFSDHGLHSKDMKGAHGTNKIHDMTAIITTISKGLK